MAALAVGRNTAVTVELELADFWGNLLQKSDSPVSYLHGGYGDLLPALGDYDEQLVRVEPRAAFPETLEVGMQFEGIPGGEPDDTIYTITDIAGDAVVLDGNHPLAGIGLEFRCTVRAVRAATEAEIGRGALDDPDAIALRVASH
jgi:FKBP-type peptidyl-prolyl cis-trans isomerase SlyD